MSIEAAAQRATAGAGRTGASARPVGWLGKSPLRGEAHGTIVAQALGITPTTLAADFEFACKAGTEAMQAASALVGCGDGPTTRSPSGWIPRRGGRATPWNTPRPQAARPS